MESNNRGTRKERVGVVTSDSMTKTVVVELVTRKLHPKYGKVMTQKKKLYAHDEKEESSVGDVVKVVETRPLSRLKRWRVVEIVTRGKSLVDAVDGM